MVSRGKFHKSKEEKKVNYSENSCMYKSQFSPINMLITSVGVELSHRSLAFILAIHFGRAFVVETWLVGFAL